MYICNWSTLNKLIIIIENEAIKAIRDRIVRDVMALEDDDYYKPIRIGNFWSNSYIEYESSGDRKKTLPVKEYLRDMIINLQKSDTWKIQLWNAITFISSKDADEERVMHSKSDMIEMMSCDNAKKVVNELFSHFFQDTKLV